MCHQLLIQTHLHSLCPRDLLPRTSMSNDLHGTTSGIANGAIPALVSTIYSTDETETPLASTAPINYIGTDWWYGLPNPEVHPFFAAGTMNHAPVRIIYNYINTTKVIHTTWSVYVLIEVTSGAPEPEGLSWTTIAIIVAVILFFLILLCFMFSGGGSDVSEDYYYDDDQY